MYGQKTLKGKFTPKNPKKYKGDVNNIIFRSSWEFKVMTFLDSHPDVLEWGSEEFSIPYLSPVDRQIHRYFPDFFVKMRKKNGEIETLVVEVKPKAQTNPPKQPKRMTPKFLHEAATYAVNESKWKSAQKFCEERKMKFLIMTEDHIFNGKKA